MRSRSRRYLPGTLVLETEAETADGAVRVIDFMPRRGDGPPQVVRIVEGLRGRVPMRSELALRPDYGTIVPWIDAVPDGVLITAGPDSFHLSTPRTPSAHDGTAVSEFVIVEGSREGFVMSWHPSSQATPRVESPHSALARTAAWWREWSARCIYDGAYSDAVRASLVVLKAMTHEPTGALVAAPTTSLPEDIGGVRNWDYRYCWLRDSVLTLEALLQGGYTDEAMAFRDFVFRAASADPANLQIMYGLGGERRLTEFELPHLPGYEGSRPVRIGNAASEQFQLDVYGEVVARRQRRPRAAGAAGATAVRAALAGDRRPRRAGLARARRRDLGGARAAAALHPLEGDGLGRLRPCGAPRRRHRAAARGRTLGGMRDEIHAEVCAARLGPRPAHLHPVLRLGRARRRRAA